MTDSTTARESTTEMTPESLPPRRQPVDVLATIRGGMRAFSRRPEAGAALSVIVIGLALSLTTSQFLTTTNLTLVARSFAFTAIAAMGVFLVIVTAGIDLSVGSVMGLAGLTVAYFSAAGMHFMLAMLLGLLAACLVGLINGVIIAGLNVAPFMVTLGMLSVIRGIDIAITNGVPIQNIAPEIKYFGQAYLLGLPVPVWIMIALGVLLSFVMNRTTFGWQVYAIGGNAESARLSGINVRRVTASVYVLSALMGGIGGLLLTARLGVGESTAGTGYELDVIAAVVIGGASLFGGRGKVVGAIWGAALLGIARNGMALLGVSSFWQQVVIGAVIVIAVVIDRFRINTPA